ncbi:dimethylarginine dimethylaminohydrolase family protein [Desulfoluna spongiiphila]|uniref:dimethylarginine dimethylaminohydrolase family protein n=1 Tax=Desulfoluna spongiiphila TaxID=419481 RepID=UPI0012532B51|nr:amidinotransferase [Desulfoluna spongiiphila]VVS93875.1 amidinotransferase [Desulfoluna spongiiphila]
MKVPDISRRTLIKGMAVASLVMAGFGMGRIYRPGRTSARAGEPLGVAHEWGTLKEALVGSPHVKIPETLSPEMRRWFPRKWQAFFDAHAGKSLAEADSELYQRLDRQMRAVIEVLRDRGVTVYRTPEMTPSDLGYLDSAFPACGAQLYPRDPFLVVGDKAIETELLFPFRRRERFGIRRALARRVEPAGNSVISMPPLVPSRGDAPWGHGAILEGGDVLVLGRDLLVGLSGNASNPEGVRWLAGCLGPGYRVHGVRLNSGFLHLDCCLSTPRPGLVVVCRDAFPDGLPQCLDGWKTIDVSAAEALEGFACNGLILDEKAMVLADEVPRVADRLRAAGQEVMEVPFDAVTFFGGSLRCWHQALVRESTL